MTRTSSGKKWRDDAGRWRDDRGRFTSPPRRGKVERKGAPKPAAKRPKAAPKRPKLTPPRPKPAAKRPKAQPQLPRPKPAAKRPKPAAKRPKAIPERPKAADFKRLKGALKLPKKKAAEHPTVKTPAWVKAQEKEKRRQAREEAKQRRFEHEERIAIQLEARKRTIEEEQRTVTREEFEAAKALINRNAGDMIRQNFHLAKNASRFRWVPGAERILAELEVIAGMTGEEVYERVAKAAKRKYINFEKAWGEVQRSGIGPFSEEFERVAGQLADAFDAPLREVYTLFFSP